MFSQVVYVILYENFSVEEKGSFRKEMFQNLYPDEDVDSAYQIDYQAYYDKGYRGILFDVDNTLVEHDQPVTIVAIELFQQLKEMGFQTCIISNNNVQINDSFTLMRDAEGVIPYRIKNQVGQGRNAYYAFPTRPDKP